MTQTPNHCTCTYHLAEEKRKKKKEVDLLPFWLTLSGLLMRIDVLSQDFLFGVTNDVVASTASDPAAATVPTEVEYQPTRVIIGPEEVISPTVTPTIKPIDEPAPDEPGKPQLKDKPKQSSPRLTAYIHYRTAEDDRVCPVCTRYGSGGEGKGYYRADGPIPLIPVHFRCRCQWELVFQNLDAPALP